MAYYNLDLTRAPYVLHGVKYIDLVSLYATLVCRPTTSTRMLPGQSISNYVTWVVRAPYVLYGVKYIDLVSLGKKGERC